MRSQITTLILVVGAFAAPILYSRLTQQSSTQEGCVGCAPPEQGGVSAERAESASGGPGLQSASSGDDEPVADTPAPELGLDPSDIEADLQTRAMNRFMDVTQGQNLIEKLQGLLDEGLSPNSGFPQRGSGGWTPLSVMSAIGRFDAALLLLRNGAHLPVLEIPRNPQVLPRHYLRHQLIDDVLSRTNKQRSPHLAPYIRELARMTAESEGWSPAQGATPLALAVAILARDDASVAKLLEAGVRPDAELPRPNTIDTPIQLALDQGHFGYVELCLAAVGGAQNLRLPGSTWMQFAPLSLAAARGWDGPLRSLIEEQVKLSANRRDRVPLELALVLAAREGQTTTCALLLEAGANPNSFSHEHGSPLVSVARAANAELLEIFARHGAVWDHYPDYPTAATLLERAMLSENASSFFLNSLLIKIGKGVDVALINPGSTLGRTMGGGVATPLCMAAQQLDPRALESLLKAGANPNGLNVEGAMSPLACACAEGNKTNFRLLIAAGASPEALRSTTLRGGKTVLQLARERRWTGLSNMILDALAALPERSEASSHVPDK